MTHKNFHKLSRTLSRAMLVAAAAGLPATTLAAGFQLTEQSVSGLGRAFAGASAYAEDASTIFYNPAGLTELDRELVMGASLIALGADLDRTTAVDAFGQPLTGGEGGDVGKLGGVPTLYYAHRLNPDWVFGLGVNAPFGLATDYDPDWIGRYQGVYSQVSSININPSLGWKVNDNWSLGFGLNAMHFRVKLTNMVDYGTVCFSQVNPVTCNALGLTPQNADGYAEIEGDSWGYGFNLGTRLQFDKTSIGLHYRSEVDQDLGGDSRFENAPAVFTAQNVFIDQGIQADFTTPETLSLSIVQRIDDNWTIAGDITYTGWSSFDEIRVNYDNYDDGGTPTDFSDDSGQRPTIQPENWDDVMRYSLGVDWRYDEAWTFRSGIAYDESPIVDEFRTVRLPGADRTWLSFGATWQLSERMQLDFGYAHLFIDDNIPITERGRAVLPPDEPSETSMGDTLIGTYEASADIAGVEFRYVF